MREANVRNLKEELIGHSIKEVYFDHLILDNGFVLMIDDTEEGPVHYAGVFNWEIEHVNNIITDVILDDFIQVGSKQAFRINMMAEDRKVTDLSVIGDEGNGYYMKSVYFAVLSPSTWLWFIKNNGFFREG